MVHKHVQLYDVVRTAHLERALAADVAPTILYSERRYDFDAELAKRVDAYKCGLVGSFVFALRHDISVLEIGEPLAIRAAPRSLSTIAAAKLRSAVLRRPRPAVVAYAIENKDPREVVSDLPTMARCKWRMHSALAPLVWSCVDRVAFGTDASRELYRSWFADRRKQPEQRLVPALPNPKLELAESEPRKRTAIFLGDFSKRKGLPQLLRAWPIIVRGGGAPDLLLIGKGALRDEAEAFARRRSDVTVHVDPSRSEIRRLLSASKVLVAPSQPTARWREQVGLPIVEALQSGCEVVTTSETGIAAWLREHGHRVFEDPESAEELASAVIEALRSSRTPSDVVSDLPLVDGRSAAAHWLVRGSEVTPDPAIGERR